MRSRLWYWLPEGSFPALGPERFKTPQTKREFRSWLREVYYPDKKQLPRGLEVWPTSEGAVEALDRNYKETQRDLPEWAKGPL